MGSDDASRERGFTIVDKRGRADDEEPLESPTAQEAGAAEASGEALPKVDFAGLTLSLATSALFHLGQVPDPETGKPAPANLPVARHTIDTLELLQEKTQGNLTEEEARLLTNVLTDLRMRFVEASR